MRALTILPRKAVSDTTAKLQLSLYWRKLGEYPEPALTYMVDQGLERWRFFPTIGECREIAGAWPVPARLATRKAIARRLVDEERRHRFKELGAAIRRGQLTDEQIEALPERTKALLDTDLVLLGRWDADLGRMVYRRRAVSGE